MANANETQVKYDDGEALDILSKYLEGETPVFEDRAAAAAELLSQFVDVAKRVGCRASFNPEKLSAYVSHRYGGIVLHATSEGSIYITGNDRGINPQPVPLQFNRATGMLESKRADAYRLPVPGEPQRARSALAELADALRDLMKSRE